MLNISFHNKLPIAKIQKLTFYQEYLDVSCQRGDINSKRITVSICTHQDWHSCIILHIAFQSSTDLYRLGKVHTDLYSTIMISTMYGINITTAERPYAAQQEYIEIINYLENFNISSNLNSKSNTWYPILLNFYTFPVAILNIRDN